MDIGNELRVIEVDESLVEPTHVETVEVEEPVDPTPKAT